MSLREAWKKHSRGDHYSDEELGRMIHQLEAAMPYMTERPGYDLAARDAAQTLSQLRGIYFNRRGRHVCSLFQIAKDMGREIGVGYLFVSQAGMAFAHPRHQRDGQEYFRSDLCTCRLLAKAIGDRCFIVNADTLERAPND